MPYINILSFHSPVISYLCYTRHYARCLGIQWSTRQGRPFTSWSLHSSGARETIKEQINKTNFGAGKHYKGKKYNEVSDCGWPFLRVGGSFALLARSFLSKSLSGKLMSPDLAKSGEEAAIQVGLGGGKGTEILRCKSSKGAFYMYGKKKKNWEHQKNWNIVSNNRQWGLRNRKESDHVGLYRPTRRRLGIIPNAIQSQWKMWWQNDTKLRAEHNG